MVKAIDWAIDHELDAITSTAPVTAGFVAMLRSLDPTLSPARIKDILMASSHPMELGGRRGERVPDLGEAVNRVRGILANSTSAS